MPAAPAPLVTVFIPMLNEAGRISACLDSVLAQRGLQGPIELLVLDGGSTDDSPAIVRRYGERYPFVRLLPNPERFQAPAFNRALAEAQGEFFVRMDAHTTYADDYVAQCVHLLRTKDAANVGGPQRPVGTSRMGRVVAAAYTSRFAAGDAAFRYSGEERWVDTVYLGAWRTDTLRRLGGMNPAWEVNEDYEMNIRLRDAGGKILLSPSIRSQYAVRPSLRSLCRQYFRYGMWRFRTVRHHPGSLRARQLAAPMLVLGLVASMLLSAVSLPLAAIIPAVYAVGLLCASVLAARGKGLGPGAALLPVVFACIHLAWGLGFLAGAIRFGRETPSTSRALGAAVSAIRP